VALSNVIVNHGGAFPFLHMYCNRLIYPRISDSRQLIARSASGKRRAASLAEAGRRVVN
jgi:hypothetical protein